MAMWTYGNWQESTDLTERLTRLRRFITELNEHLIGMKTRTGAAHFPVEEARIANLERQMETLAARVEGTGVSVARSRARFRS